MMNPEKKKNRAKERRDRYKARFKKGLIKMIGQVATIPNMKQRSNPGMGWEYKIDGNMFWLGVDLSKAPIKKSRQGKSYTLATTCGPYNLTAFGHPDVFIICHACRDIPINQIVDLDGITKVLKEIEEEE